MQADSTSVLLFGLCCAIATGHLFTGVLGFALGRQRIELNALFAGLTTCAAWTVFWLGVYQTWPVEQIARVRFASQLFSGFIGPLLLLFCWGLVRPERPLPRPAFGLLGLGLFGAAASLYAAVNPDEIIPLMRELDAGGSARHPVITPLFVTHSLAALGTTLTAAIVLLHAVFRSPLPQVRGQAGWMLLAAATAIAGFVFGNVMYVAFDVDVPWMAPLASVPALGLSYRALLSSRDLVRRLKTERKNLSRFVPSLVADRAETELRLGGQEALVAVLFTDLRGFTALSEDLDPAEVIRLLNTYLGRMTDVVQAHGGFVDKYIGDAVLAVFGLEPHGSHPCQAALDAGRAMQQALAELNADGKLPQMRMGVGIHYGNVVHGNVGSEARMDYTVLGDTVNLASRVEAMCKELDVDLVLTAQVAAHVAGELRDLGDQTVRGRRQVVRVFAG